MKKNLFFISINASTQTPDRFRRTDPEHLQGHHQPIAPMKNGLFFLACVQEVPLAFYTFIWDGAWLFQKSTPNLNWFDAGLPQSRLVSLAQGHKTASHLHYFGDRAQNQDTRISSFKTFKRVPPQSVQPFVRTHTHPRHVSLHRTDELNAIAKCCTYLSVVMLPHPYIHRRNNDDRLICGHQKLCLQDHLQYHGPSSPRYSPSQASPTQHLLDERAQYAPFQLRLSRKTRRCRHDPHSRRPKGVTNSFADRVIAQRTSIPRFRSSRINKRDLYAAIPPL